MIQYKDLDQLSPRILATEAYAKARQQSWLPAPTSRGGSRLRRVCSISCFGLSIGACSRMDGKCIYCSLRIYLLTIPRWKQAGDNRLAALNGLKFSVWISRGAGLVLSVDVLMILLPMCRNILRVIRPKIRWLPLDESQWFHRQVAYALLFFTCVHTGAHYVKYVLADS